MHHEREIIFLFNYECNKNHKYKCVTLKIFIINNLCSKVMIISDRLIYNLSVLIELYCVVLYMASLW